MLEQAWCPMDSRVNNTFYYIYNQRQPGEKRFWLAKVEPSELTIDGLARLDNQTTKWEGVRNHEAKQNLLAMRVGDEVFFYQVRPLIFSVVVKQK